MNWNNNMMEAGSKTKAKSFGCLLSTKTITSILVVFLILIFLHIQASPFYASTSSSSSWNFNHHFNSTFLPLKNLKLAKTAMIGNTWFMSDLNDTHEENESEYIYFPSPASKGRVLCIKGHDKGNGTKNSYALAWPKSLPDSAILMKGLSFISDTYYDYENLWHGICAIAPFVGWSIKNQCVKPTRWVLYHWGEVRERMGLWLQDVVQANFGEVKFEGFENGGGDGIYCFEKAVVMRHNLGMLGKKKKLEVFNLLRCKAREFCGISSERIKVNENGVPIIWLTLLMRRGSRSFKNASAVTDIFSRECTRVEGCILKVAQSEDLSFCDQVRVMTNTDIVASPHGAQLTNMLFMDRNSSVMEFFPKGWLELAGIGQYAHHWMADQSGMKHRGAWWDPNGEEECPFPKQDPRCFMFYKDGKVGHNETFFGEWARKVLNQVRISKLEQTSKSFATKLHPNTCLC